MNYDEEEKLVQRWIQELTPDDFIESYGYLGIWWDIYIVRETGLHLGLRLGSDGKVDVGAWHLDLRKTRYRLRKSSQKAKMMEYPV